jgi:hypothetical protein
MQGQGAGEHTMGGGYATGHGPHGRLEPLYGEPHNLTVSRLTPRGVRGGGRGRGSGGYERSSERKRRPPDSAATDASAFRV